jgi:hypothetical protein
LTIDPSVAATITPGVTYQGRVAVYNQPFTCSVPSETVSINRDMTFKRGEQLFASTPELGILSGPTGGQLFGPPARFDFDLSGESAGECLKDLNLYLGVTPLVGTVPDIASHIQIAVTSPSGLQRVIWLANPISEGSPYDSEVTALDGTILPALYLDDQIAPPLGPYLLSAFNNQQMKGHWYVDVSAEMSGYRLGPASFYFTKAALCH